MESQSTPGRLKLEDEVIEKITGSSYIQGELFTYITIKKYPCTKNENGLFMNISSLSEDILQDIHTRIHHIEEYNQSVTDKELLLTQLANDNISHVTEPPSKPHYKPFHLSAFQRRILNLTSS